MAEYDTRSPVEGTIPTHDYTDDDERAALVSEDEEEEEAGVSADSDDEGPAERIERPIHKQLDDFKKLVLTQTSGISWDEIWRKFDLIDDRPGNGQSEVDDRTALHILVAEHVQSTDKDVSQALVKAIANITKRYPGLVSRLDRGGKTPLYDAIANRQARVVKHLVKNCGSRKTKNPDSDHPLVQAVRTPCSYNGRRENALHIAFREMPKAVDKETLKTLCEHATEGAVSYPDAKGFTALHYAVRYRHSSMEQFEMIGILLRKGQSSREDQSNPVMDVLDHYANVKIGDKTVLMSVFEYHVHTRRTYDQESFPSANGRGKRSGKDADTGKMGRHNDKRREVEQTSTSTTADGKRLGNVSSAQATPQPSVGTLSKTEGDAKKSQPLPERLKDERTGKGFKADRTASMGKVPKEIEDRHDSGKQGSQARSMKQGGHRPAEESKADSTKESAQPNIGITRRNTGICLPAKLKIVEPLETAEEKKQRRDEWSDKIKNELKIQVLRNRPFYKATRFLYGKNLENVHIYFDYQGQAANVDPETFEDSFKDVKFDSILKYVAFPHVKVQGWDKHPKNILKGLTAQGRTDMLFFFQWLRSKGVKRILRVIVDDVHPTEYPHSDESIEECLKGMGVEELEWQKKDLDPDTICRIDGFGESDNEQNSFDDVGIVDEGNPEKCPKDEIFTGTLRVLRLWWNGDNAVLRGWSDPEGLRQLPRLTRIHLTTRKSLESKERTERNIKSFKIRMKSRYVRGALRQGSLSVDMAVGNDNIGNESSRSTKKTRFEDSDSEESVPDGIEVTYARVGQPSGMKTHNNSQDRDLIVRPSHRWLNSTDEFGVKLAHVWKKLVYERKADKPRDIVIALIDDGIDATDNRLKDKIIPGRTLSSDNDRIRPWYVSDRGHGTLMATSICRVCPMAKIYPIRLHTTGAANSWQSSIDASSAIKAIDAAVDMGVDIISISWTIKPPQDSIREKFKAAIERASNILIFCSAADGGHMGGPQYPSALSPESFIRIGAARADGLPYEKVGELSGVEFIMPGVDVMPPELSPGISQEVIDRSITGSSVAAALGSGLAAMIFYCINIAALSGKAGITEKDLERLRRPAEMKRSIERFGMSSSKDSGNKFVEVFNKLDKKSLELGHSTLPDDARSFIADLARDLISRS